MNGSASPTRFIALASAALADGFSLIGVETRPDATAEDLERLLQELVTREERALLFLEDRLARSGGPWLTRVRNEGGRIIVTELPALHAPADYNPAVDAIVRATLGPSALGAES